MNIFEIEAPLEIVAKTCGCREKNRLRVTYQFMDSYPSLCLDKKDLILAQLQACERLLEYVVNEENRNTESEITEVIEIKTLLERNQTAIYKIAQ
jgi:hypothetical protein